MERLAREEGRSRNEGEWRLDEGELRVGDDERRGRLRWEEYWRRSEGGKGGWNEAEWRER